MAKEIFIDSYIGFLGKEYTTSIDFENEEVTYHDKGCDLIDNITNVIIMNGWNEKDSSRLADIPRGVDKKGFLVKMICSILNTNVVYDVAGFPCIQVPYGSSISSYLGALKYIYVIDYLKSITLDELPVEIKESADVVEILGGC